MSMAKEKHNPQSVENEILMQGQDPESYDHASPETDGLTGQDPVGASLDNIENQRADEAEQASRSEDSQEEAAETSLEETEGAARDFQKETGESEEKPTVAAYVTAAEKKKSTSLYKLAFSAIIFCTFIIVT